MEGLCRGIDKTFRALAAAVVLIAAAATGAGALDQYPGDTAIYGISTATVEPNVLIILDNSGSMSGEVSSGVSFDPNATYAETKNCDGGLDCKRNKVYQWRSSSRTWITYINDVNTISCATAKSRLLTTGVYNGKLRTNGTCGGSSASYATGNYINWESAYGPRPKIDIAKEVITNLLNATSGVRFGLMIFNNNEGGHIAGVNDSYGWSGYQAYIKDMDEIFTGATTNRAALVSTVNNLTASTWTPLGETLFEAMRYYSGGSTAFSSVNGNVTYSSPIQYSCQKHYVIIITDGMSTQDQNAVLRTICNNGDCDGDGRDPGSFGSYGSDYLDDVAKYLYDTDLLPDTGVERTIGKQNVITHTIGFGLTGADAAAVTLLQQTAYNGGGNYFLASSTSGLSESLRQILATIIEDNTSFVAPVVPISPENRTTSGRRIYLGFFKPQSGAFWYGNLKKFGRDDNGDIIDVNGSPATNADGSFRDNAVSYWSSAADGGQVEKGGVGALLLTRGSARNIYTYTGSSAALANPTNAFTDANASLTQAMLNVTSAAERTNLINYVHGYDAYDSNSNGITNEKRAWVLGDIMHSKPLVVNYSTYTYANESSCTANKTMIYFGANDGLLHAFRDCDGAEAWAFIPQDLLPSLAYMAGNTHSYYVDSSPSVYIYDANDNGVIESGDKVVIMFGERRGGGYYYALDVTDPASPRYMWRLSSAESPSGTNTDYSELAESWSEPVIVKVGLQSGGVNTYKVAAFIGAGYDNASEDAQPALGNTVGRGVYAVEIAALSAGVPSFGASGTKIWGYTTTQNSNLTKSIPSQLTVIDSDGNGYADRLYASDVGGGVWRFDVGSNLVSAWSGRKIFQSNPGADATTGRKMFYRPVVTREVGYEMLFFGTGDREHPVDTSVVDRLYAVKDTGQTSTRAEGNLVDATNAATVDVSGNSGWYIKLASTSGEKVLASAIVVDKVAYYSSYAPSSSGTSVCTADNRGAARVYALSYLNAGAALNFYTGNDAGGTPTLGISDRNKAVGTGIPSEVISASNPDGSWANGLFTGGGGPSLGKTRRLGGIPIYWREVR